MNRSDRSPSANLITVWDPLVRIFHWSLVSLFFIAYLTEDDWLDLHSFAGYSIMALLLFRICWGLIGTRYARFSSFVTGPDRVVKYLKSIWQGNPEHHVGHNPAGGAMIIVMLILLLLICFSGIATLATEGAGPLAGTFIATLSDDWLEEIHEALANLMLAAVALHVAGVLISSLLHHENLVKAMFNGRKRAE